MSNDLYSEVIANLHILVRRSRVVFIEIRKKTNTNAIGFLGALHGHDEIGFLVQLYRSLALPADFEFFLMTLLLFDRGQLLAEIDDALDRINVEDTAVQHVAQLVLLAVSESLLLIHDEARLCFGLSLL